jgi:hypothetical protein
MKADPRYRTYPQPPLQERPSRSTSRWKRLEMLQRETETQMTSLWRRLPGLRQQQGKLTVVYPSHKWVQRMEWLPKRYGALDIHR